MRCATATRYRRRCGICRPASATIVRLRFACDMTQSEIAAEMGISQMHVSRLLRSALAKLREVMDDPALLAS